MAFDQTTRNRLQRFVNDARRVLEEEFTRQLQNDYGMDPNAGSVAELTSLRHINDAQRETARILRDTLAQAPGPLRLRELRPFVGPATCIAHLYREDTVDRPDRAKDTPATE